MIKLISILIPYYQRDDELFLWVQERISEDELNGLLEFPGGKIEGDESTQEAAQRETLEETGVDISLSAVKRLGSFEFSGGLVIFVHLFEDEEQTFSSRGYYRPDELLRLESKIPPNNVEILGQVKRYFEDFKS